MVGTIPISITLLVLLVLTTVGLELCRMADRWTHNGRDLVRDYRANVLLVAFVPLESCGDRCHYIFNSYEQMIRDCNGAAHALIVAPQSADARLTRNYSAHHTTLRFEHETIASPIWRWFGAGIYDHFIFDRCSRLTEKLSFNSDGADSTSDVSLNGLPRHLENTVSRLNYALNYVKCGWCQYDELKSKNLEFTTEPIITTTVDLNTSTASDNGTWTSTVIDARPHLSTEQPPAIETIRTDPPVLRSSYATYHGRTPQSIVHQSHSVVNVAESRTTTSMVNVVQPTQSQTIPYRRQQLQRYASTTPDLPYRSYQSTISNEAVRRQTMNWPSNQQQQRLQQLQQQQSQQKTNRQQEQRVTEQQHQWRQQYQQQLQKRQQQQQQSSNQQQHLQHQFYQHRQQWPQQELQRHIQKQMRQQQGRQEYSQTRENENPLETHKTKENEKNKNNKQPVQYAKDTYADRYQYRLHSYSFNKAQRQRAAERRHDAERRRLDEDQRRQQIEALQRAREQQRLEQLEFQKQQKAAAELQQRRVDEERRNRQGRPSSGTDGASDPAPLYPDGTSSLEYYEDEDEWTTPLPDLKAFAAPSSTVNVVQPLENRDYGLILPCDSYNDDICYQQTQLKSHEIHRCCRNRVLLTDQCRPGKCSNVTQQLCCIQKFLQAKLTCCNDEKQLEVNTAGDHFNRCCHGKFITNDDSCCTRSYASAQWRTVHELCHPNVDVDLSRVRVPTLLAGTSLTTEFDFGKTDRWNFICKYGTHVPQFSYSSDTPAGTSGEIFRRRR